MIKLLAQRFLRRLQVKKIQTYQRRVPIGDLLTERRDNAAQYGFGPGTTCYDSVLIIGKVSVGSRTWIGPFVILDGSGGLEIGDQCSISAGVHIYTHDTVGWALNNAPYSHSPVKIGSNVYIGPNSIIARGVTIGDGALIGALSFVNSDIPAGAKVFGQPARPRE